MKIATIKSSGKNGTESAALLAAKNKGIRISGYKPKGADSNFTELKDCLSAKEEQAILWNVRDSHATLIIGQPEKIGAAELSYELAETFGRPNLISANSDEIINWLDTLGEELTINVTGLSAEEDPLSKKNVRILIEKVISHYDVSYLER